MARLNVPPRHQLGFFPTPFIELQHLTDHLRGPKLFMKRDDQTGLALGGNKTRKLEFLIADALKAGADAVITAGAAQSNHCRQTAAAAAVCGLECHLVLGGSAPNHFTGNLLLDQLFGAHLHWAGEHRKGETSREIAEHLQNQGRQPYIIPYGGSNATGAVGFVAAVEELYNQMLGSGQNFTHIVFASSSGGTQAGLVVGCRVHLPDVKILGINIDKGGNEGSTFDQHILNLIRQTASMLLMKEQFHKGDVLLCSDYLGEGYGVVGQLERQAISLVARKEGILLDPVYTGRAMGGLLDLIETGYFKPDDTILFWHTGGTPALFSHAEDMVSKPDQERPSKGIY